MTAEQCASLSVQHPDYNTLASRIIISNHHRNTDSSFFSAMEKLYNFTDIHDKHTPLISNELFDIISDNKDTFESMIVHDRDYLSEIFLGH